MPDFPGPPSDAWIDQLDEYGVASQPQLTEHYHCSFSAIEPSLRKFDLEKFDGSPTCRHRLDHVLERSAILLCHVCLLDIKPMSYRSDF